LRFRRFRQWKHFTNVQPEPALANTVEHIVCAALQFFALAMKWPSIPPEIEIVRQISETGWMGSGSLLAKPWITT
jgi:hypothetical protein